jgi:flagellar biosynthesis protein FlhA
VAGSAVLCLAVIPGLPKLPFLLVGGSVLLIAQRLEKPAAATAQSDEPALALPSSPDSPDSIARDMRVEPLELELAYDLIDLVDPSTGGDLLDRVRALRRKLALELGIVIPLVRTRDNLDLPPRSYAIRLHGVEIARGEAPPGMVLAVGDGLSALPGTPAKEPVFGLDAKWVPMQVRRQAELAGATVVDRASVIMTHLAEVARRHAPDLLGREDVKALVDMVKTTHPVVVEELTPAPLSLGEIQRALQSLLAERVPIRDLVRIFEALSARARTGTDSDGLVEAARAALGPAISMAHAVDGQLPVVTFDPRLEQSLLESLRTGEQGAFLMIDAALADHLARETSRVVTLAEERGESPVLVCAQHLRPAVRRLLVTLLPQLAVLSYGELAGQLSVVPIGVVNAAPAFAA